MTSGVVRWYPSCHRFVSIVYNTKSVISKPYDRRTLCVCWIWWSTFSFQGKVTHENTCFSLFFNALHNIQWWCNFWHPDFALLMNEWPNGVNFLLCALNPVRSNSMMKEWILFLIYRSASEEWRKWNFPTIDRKAAKTKWKNVGKWLLNQEWSESKVSPKLSRVTIMAK